MSEPTSEAAFEAGEWQKFLTPVGPALTDDSLQAIPVSPNPEDVSDDDILAQEGFEENFPGPQTLLQKILGTNQQ